MMPDNSLSTEPVVTDYLYPDNLVNSADRDYEMGGIAIEDASQGLLYQPWTFWSTDGGPIYCGPLSGGSEMLIDVSGVTSVSGTFDRNMRPAVAYAIGDTGYLWWFDATVNEMTTTTFPGISEIRVTHDDKRPTADFRSDVLVAYTRDGNLYYRQQRDRYTIERLLAENLVGQLRNMGMTTALRIQFDIN